MFNSRTGAHFGHQYLPRRVSRFALFALALLGAPLTVHGGEVRVAVAANFSAAAHELGAAFELVSGHHAIVSSGSTGQLYAQIAQGAPYDVFLAADRLRPARALKDGYAVAGSQFTYAIGRLVLYSADPSLVRGERTLVEAVIDRLAIANPATAPYGAAALQVLEALGARARLDAALVRGNNVAQAYQFVLTGNAAAGLIARSQLVGVERGSRWLVPATLHAPIAQDAVLLRAARDVDAARAFLAFLGGPKARALVERHGYAAGS